MVSQINKRITESFMNRHFGITYKDLTWTERAALFNYIDSLHFNKKVWGEGSGARLSNLVGEGIYRFMDAYFDLDARELNKAERRVIGKNDLEYQRGADFMGTPEFKQHVRDRIQMWRDERELI